MSGLQLQVIKTELCLGRFKTLKFIYVAASSYVHKATRLANWFCKDLVDMYIGQHPKRQSRYKKEKIFGHQIAGYGWSSN